MRLLLRALAVVALAALTVSFVPQSRTALAAAGVTPALDVKNLDPSCKACDDFWTYATGGWQKRTKIPAGYPSWNSFAEIYERNLLTERGILDDAARDAATTTDPDERRIGLFYAACIDQKAVDARGLEALQPELDRINGVSSVPELVGEIARLERLGVDAGLGFGSEADTRDSSKTIGAVGYGGLGLPDRDDYLTPAHAPICATRSRPITRRR